MTACTTLHLITTTEEFQTLAKDWDALLVAVGIENIFLTHAWLSEWWQVYGSDRELWMLVARGDHGLEGIAPFMLEFDTGRLAFLGDSDVAPNHLDLIVLPEIRFQFIQNVSEFIAKSCAKWKILDLDNLVEGSSTPEILLDSLRRHGVQVELKLGYLCPYIVLPESFQAYFDSRGKQTRKTLRRAQAYFMETNPNAQYHLVENETDFEATFEALIRLHQAYWTEQGEPGAFSNDKFVSFHRDIFFSALAKGWLRMYYLKIGDDYIAIDSGFRINAHLFYYLGAYDKRWAQYRPGIQLINHVVERSILEGCSEVDFLQGNEEYKSHWATHTRTQSRLYAFSPHWRGQLEQKKRWVIQVVRHLIHRLTPRKIRSELKELLAVDKPSHSSH